jgi:hypothetical protein
MSTTNDGFHPYQHHQSVTMMPYMMYPSRGLPNHSSSGASLSTSSSSNNHNMNILYYQMPPNMNMSSNWQQHAAMMPRYLPSHHESGRPPPASPWQSSSICNPLHWTLRHAGPHFNTSSSLPATWVSLSRNESDSRVQPNVSIRLAGTPTICTASRHPTRATDCHAQSRQHHHAQRLRIRHNGTARCCTAT